MLENIRVCSSLTDYLWAWGAQIGFAQQDSFPLLHQEAWKEIKAHPGSPGTFIYMLNDAQPGARGGNIGESSRSATMGLA